MADLIRFTRNHEDLSTDRGYQFDFFCDICHNSFRSPYEASVAGRVGEIARGVSNLFGGVLGRVGHAAYDMQRAVGGKGHGNATYIYRMEGEPDRAVRERRSTSGGR